MKRPEIKEYLMGGCAEAVYPLSCHTAFRWVTLANIGCLMSMGSKR